MLQLMHSNYLNLILFVKYLSIFILLSLFFNHLIVPIGLINPTTVYWEDTKKSCFVKFLLCEAILINFSLLN